MKEVDAVGRRAAQMLTIDVEQHIDTDDALRRLHEGRVAPLIELVHHDDGSGQRPDRRGGRRRPMQIVAAGMAVAAVTLVGIVAVRDHGSSRVSPGDSVATTVSTEPTPTALTPIATSVTPQPSITPPIRITPEIATVTVDGATDTLIGEVVFSTEGAAPWVGAVTPSGRIFIGFGEGPPTKVFEVIDGQLVDTGITTKGRLRSATDERLYDVDWTANELVVWAQVDDGQWSVQRTDGPVNDCGFVAQPDEVRCGGVTLPVEPAANVSHVQWTSGASVAVSNSGSSAAWQIQLVSGEVSLDDCTNSGCEQYVRAGDLGIVWTPTLQSSSRENQQLVSLLQPGQPAATAWLDCPGAPCQIIGADSDAIYTLGAAGGLPSSLLVGRFTFADIASPPLVSDSATVDALAGFPAPPITTPTLDDVPRLLPDLAAIEAGRGALGEGADDPATMHVYTQTFMAEGAEAPALTIETNIGQGAIVNGGRDVSVSPWDRGAEPPMAPGYASLVLEDPSGSVIIWSRNLTRADLLAVAEGMTLREDGQPGWHLKNVPPGLTPIHEGWGLGAASRFARWSGAGLEMELTIVHGVSAMFTNLPGIGSTAFVDIRGARGVAYDLDDRSAVVWSPAPDLVVLLGLYGPVETAIELARSSVPVDEATWLAATTSAPAGQDGCNSMFC